MSATKNECNRGSPSIYRPEANAWISKRSSDLDYKGVFALIKIGFLQSSFYEVMWSSLICHINWEPDKLQTKCLFPVRFDGMCCTTELARAGLFGLRHIGRHTKNLF